MATALTALGEAFGLVSLPTGLTIGAERRPIAFALHMGSGGLALVFVPLAIGLARNGRAHRLAGRFAAATVLIAGLSAIPIALESQANVAARASFLVQAGVWLVLLAVGLQTIRVGKRDLHAACMIVMAGVTSGALILRLMLAAQARLCPFADFDAAYGVMAWVAWTIPATFCALYAWRRDIAPVWQTRLRGV